MGLRDLELERIERLTSYRYENDAEDLAVGAPPTLATCDEGHRSCATCRLPRRPDNTISTGPAHTPERSATG